MKIRESGMPDEAMWAMFFNAPRILAQLGCNDPSADVVEFGCGYGTFTVTAATRTRGIVFALDIDPVMIEATGQKVRRRGLSNVQTVLRDFVADGTGLACDSAGLALLFNILHTTDPLGLLREAWRVLQPSGRVAVIHWNYDPQTPRGPSLAIRPHPEQCWQWLAEAGFEVVVPLLSLPPYHYGMAGQKPTPAPRRDP